MRAAIVGLWLATATLLCAGVIDRRLHDPEPYFQARAALAPPLWAAIERLVAWIGALRAEATTKSWTRIFIPQIVERAILLHSLSLPDDAERLRDFFAATWIAPSIKQTVAESCGDLRSSDPSACIRRAQNVLSQCEAKEWDARRRADQSMFLAAAPAIVGFSLLLASWRESRT